MHFLKSLELCLLVLQLLLMVWPFAEL
ncbi:hypothetical protein Gotur_005208 [Gossypium turneri]